MALQAINQNLIGLYGEVLTSAYIRVEPKLEKSGDKVSYEIYFYRDKDSYLNGGLTIKKNESYTIEYSVTNGGYILYGLHYLLLQKLLSLKYYDIDLGEELPVYSESDLSIVDVDTP